MARGGKRPGAGRKSALPDYWRKWLLEQVESFKLSMAQSIASDGETKRLREKVYNSAPDPEMEQLKLPSHLQGLGYEPPVVPKLSPFLKVVRDETHNELWREAGYDEPPLSEDGEVEEPGAGIRLRELKLVDPRGYMPAIYDRVADTFNNLQELAGSELRLNGHQVDQICRESRRQG